MPELRFGTEKKIKVGQVSSVLSCTRINDIRCPGTPPRYVSRTDSGIDHLLWKGYGLWRNMVKTTLRVDSINDPLPQFEELVHWDWAV